MNAMAALGDGQQPVLTNIERTPSRNIMEVMAFGSFFLDYFCHLKYNPQFFNLKLLMIPKKGKTEI